MENLLDLTPIRLRDYRTNESKGDGNISVLVPKFGTGKIGTWLRKRMKNPDYRVHLDDFGSHVWQLCDGTRSTAEISDLLSTAFPEAGAVVKSDVPQILSTLAKLGAVSWVK